MQQMKPLYRFGATTIGLVLALSGTSACTTPTATGAAPAVASVAQTEHTRQVPLKGGYNFRDLGGYTGAGGKTVRWGMLFRSGTMTHLTPGDFAYLKRIGLRTVADFRSVEERQVEPVVWPQGGPTVLADDYKIDLNPMTQSLAHPEVTEQHAVDVMTDGYRTIPYDLASQYRRMFAQLLAGNAPLAFNCSAGKDRTGIAAALILTALGVSRDDVFKDYLLTNRYILDKMTPQSTPSKADEVWGAMSPAATRALAAADRRFLEAMFDAIDKRSGSIDLYLEREIGLSKIDIAALRARYLE